MTQDLGPHAEPPNISKPYPICSGCGAHDVSCTWREDVCEVRCDKCAPRKHRITWNQRWPWWCR